MNKVLAGSQDRRITGSLDRGIVKAAETPNWRDGGRRWMVSDRGGTVSAEARKANSFLPHARTKPSLVPFRPVCLPPPPPFFFFAVPEHKKKCGKRDVTMAFCFIYLVVVIRVT